MDAGLSGYVLETLAREAVERARAEAARHRWVSESPRSRRSPWAVLRTILTGTWRPKGRARGADPAGEPVPGGRGLHAYRKGITMRADRVD